MDSSETDQSGRDSGAQAQHLRTVHFAIGALCLALVAGWSRQSQTEYGRALDQLHGLSSASEKIRKDPLFLDTLTKDTAEAAMRASAASTDPVLKFSWPDRQTDPTIRLEGPSGPRCISLQIRHPYTLFAPGAGAPSFVGIESLQTSANEPHVIPPLRPTTIEQFERFWKATEAGIEVYYPVALTDTYRLLQGPHVTDVEAGRWSASDSSCQDSYGTDVVCYPRLMKREGIEAAGFEFRGLCDRPGTASPRWELAIPARGMRATVNSGAALRALFTPQPPESDFREAFADLVRISHPFRNEGFEIAEDILNESRKQVAAASSQQLLGVTIPANRLWLWGVLAVLGAQWYMLSLLREFAGRIRPQDSAWAVAWIGLYDGATARFLFTSSAFYAPPLVLIYVHWQERAEGRLNLGLALASVLLAGLASLWSHECWKVVRQRRPSRQEEPEVQALDRPWRRWATLLRDKWSAVRGRLRRR